MSRATYRREQRSLQKVKNDDLTAENTVRQLLRSHQDCDFDDLVKIIKDSIEANLYKKIFDEVNETIVTAMSCAVIMALKKETNWVPITEKGKPGMMWKIMESIHDSYVECESIIENKGMLALKDVVCDMSGIDFEYSPVGNRMEAQIIMGEKKNGCKN